MGSTAIGSLASSNSIDLAELEGDVVAVDAYIQLHQFIHSITDEWGDYIRNDDGLPISHLVGLVSRLGPVLDAGIKPVFVFDGGFHELKAEEVESRRSPDAVDNFVEAKQRGDKSAAKRYAHQKAHVSDFMLESSKQLLDAMGVPFIQAPGEAEPQAAELVARNDADTVASQDWDVMLYDVPWMVRDLTTGGASRVYQSDILETSGWSLEELRWYAIVNGTDYNRSPHGVGPAYSKRIVNNATSFEEVIERAKSYDDSVDYERWWDVLELLDNQSVTTDYELEWHPFNLDATHAVACDTYGLADWQVENRLSNIENTEVVQ